MLYKERLKNIREENDLKARDIDKILNFKCDTYKVFENENTILPIKHLNNICNYFDVSIDYVFEFTSIKQYKDNRKEIDNKLSGKRLKELRKENKITQEKFAEIFNTASTTISGYERGARIIATAFLYEICKKYNISADYLLGRIDEPKYLK